MRVALAGVALALMLPIAVQGQAGAILAGNVLSDSTERPIAGAEISIPALRVAVRSDSAGGFVIPGIAAGRQVVTVRAVGYAELTTTLVFGAGERIETDLLLRPVAQSLAKVEVTAAPPSGDNPRIAEFEERRKLGHGRFVTQEVLEKAEGRKLTDVLIGRIPGLQRIRCQNGRMCLSSGRGVIRYVPGPCPIRIVFDGIPDASPLPLEDMDPSMIAAVEFYTPATLPPRFNFDGNNPCGTLLLWSRQKLRF
jgi:hypothetical protein